MKRDKLKPAAGAKDGELYLRHQARELHADTADGSVLLEVPEWLDATEIPADLPAICFKRSSRAEPGESAYLDLVVPDDLVSSVQQTVAEQPMASLILTQLLRSTGELPITQALAMESMAYSLLQTGPEFSRWLATRPSPQAQFQDHPTVLVNESLSGKLEIVLNRPQAANALTAQMRTELHDLLQVAFLNEDQIELSACGKHFSAGGDLSEFGITTDPLVAHAHRLSQNIPGSVASLAPRLTVRVHGACIGAGMELSSFAGKVIASPGTFWKLPEVSMGLLPGCGGTVSIPRRIGRQRTLLLALANMELDTPTALAWGLIDEVES